jgi:ABC-type multidrug transport system fused ATPase/permease subunit
MFVTTLVGIVILWYGGHRVIEGALTVGQLLFFYTLLGYLLGPLERLASVNLRIQDSLVAGDRLYQVLDIEVEKRSDAKQRPLGELGAGLELQDVSTAVYGRGYAALTPLCQGRILGVPPLAIEKEDSLLDALTHVVRTFAVRSIGFPYHLLEPRTVRVSHFVR